jgi:hypothetical protein
MGIRNFSPQYYGIADLQNRISTILQLSVIDVFILFVMKKITYLLNLVLSTVLFGKLNFIPAN